MAAYTIFDLQGNKFVLVLRQLLISKSMSIFKKILLVLLISWVAALVLFCTLPYFFAVNDAVVNESKLPFSNSHLIKINNELIHYRTYHAAGDSIKGNILLIHGFCGSTFSWRKNADTLAGNGYNVVAVDLPGFGYSDRSPGLNHSATFNAQLLWQLLDTIHQGNWILAGHSMGAGTALAMASLHPEKTEKLILVDGAYSNSRGSSGAFGYLLTSGPVKRWAEVLGHRYFFNTTKIHQLLASAYSSAPDSDAVNGYLAPLMLKNTASDILDLATSKEISNVNLETLKMPVLSVWGKDDKWVPYNKSQKYLEPLTALKTVMLDSAGHCPMETQRAAFNTNLLTFLNSK